MNLKRINLLKIISIFLVIVFNFQHFARSQTLPSAQMQVPNNFNAFSQFQKEEKQKLTQEQIIYRSNLIIQEYSKQYEIEKFYSQESNQELKLQGYDFFEKNQIFISGRNTNVSGSVQDDHILSTGDMLIFVFQGGRNEVFKTIIEKDGFLYLDFTAPISALGRTFGEVKKEILSRVDTYLTETEVYISLGKLDQISVTIAGEVNIPGVYKIDPFSTAMDALLVAGGIKKSGTLRNIKVIEDNKFENIDLYSFLFGVQGTKKQNVLKNGSTIIVPNRGNTVAAVGAFNKVGIYEILEGVDKAKDLIIYSGNYSRPGNFFLTRKSLFKNKDIDSNNIKKNEYLNDGDIILSYSDEEQSDATTEIIGAIKNPGKYPFEQFNKLSKIIPSTNYLKADSYNLSIIIERLNKDTLSQKFVVQNIIEFLKNNQEIELNANDKLYFFSESDIDFLSSHYAMNAFEKINGMQVCEELLDFAKMLNDPVLLNDFRLLYIRNYFKDMKNNLSTLSINKNDPTDKKSLISNSGENKLTMNSNKASEVNNCSDIPKIFHYQPKLLLAVYKNLKIIKGKVSNPGLYLFNDKENINSLLSFAGALSENFIISPNRQIISVQTKTLELTGSVKFPSVFEYLDGMMLSQILESSDYLLDETYPFFGAVIRKSKETNISRVIAFNPSLIMSKSEDLKLNASDKIILFNTNTLNNVLNFLQVNNYENKILSQKNFSDKTDNQEIINNENIELQKQKTDILSTQKQKNKFLDPSVEDNKTLVLLNQDSGDVSKSLIKEDNSNIPNNSPDDKKIDNLNEINKEDLFTICKELGIETQKNLNLCIALLNELNQSVIDVKGKVKSPRKYFVGDYANINEIINFAGGFTNEADKSNIEVSNALPNLQNSNYVYPLGTIFVDITDNYRANIQLVGNFLDTRDLSYKPNLKLSNVLKSISQLRNNSYLYFATIQRINEAYGQSNLLPFSPIEVINGSQDKKLLPGDIIKIYTKGEIENLLSIFIKNVGYQTPALNFDDITNLPQLTGDLPELIRSLTIRVEGAVVKPNLILVASLLSIENIIEIVGGLNNEANPNEIEIVFPKRDGFNNFILDSNIVDFEDKNHKSQLIFPGSSIKVPKVDNDLSLGYVELKGAVYQPGKFQILEGDSIFNIIKRSGGLLEDAYLKGLVFSRVKEQKREKEAIKRLKGELEKAILAAIESQSSANKVSFSDINPLRELIVSANQFQPIGRVIGNFDTIESLKNTKVMSGDKIFIPSRPNSITVIGEVMSPGSILWNASSNSNQYIQKAAGFTELAETKKVFIIAPNGQATRKGGLWSYNNILPGSTIVVPRRIKLTSNLDAISAVTSVIYQLTVTLAGIDNLLND